MHPLNKLFCTPDGRSFGRTFLLLCALFLLSGICNSMLDTLNKHFQNSFAISKMKSALVQNAFYLGYFVMALPAGMLERDLLPVAHLGKRRRPPDE